MKKTSIGHAIHIIEQQLLPKFHDPILCNQYARWLLQAITGKNELALMSMQEFNFTAQEQAQLDHYLEQLIKNDMPLQYLLGSTPFVGLDIIVRPPILIPRPETEEWCIALIEQLQPLKEPLSILDLCTGSGCIALALADALPKAKVYGTDISDTALALAQENARHNHISNVTFLHSDLFAEISAQFTFDIIVGNPPYIDEKEWPTLDTSVTKWEDKNALIAPDRGLALIKKIIDTAPIYLKKNSILQEKNIPQLILEIDSSQGNVVREYMKHVGYTSITIDKDLEGKDRVAKARADNVAIFSHSD